MIMKVRLEVIQKMKKQYKLSKDIMNRKREQVKSNKERKMMIFKL